MEAQLYKDLTKIVKRTPGACDGIGILKLLAKFASKLQKTDLIKRFPELFGTTRTGTFKVLKPAVTLQEQVTGRDTRLDITLGGFGHEAAAKMEASQFLHPEIFRYRTAIFPDPRSHGVTVKVGSATPVKLEKPNPLYPWGVKLQLTVAGPPNKQKVWCDGFRTRVRTQIAT